MVTFQQAQRYFHIKIISYRISELKTPHHELVREYSGIRDFQTGLLIFQYGQTFDHVFDTLTLTKILIYIYEISLGG